MTPRKLIKVHITASKDELHLAVRAAEWLIRQPATQKDAIISYGEKQDFFVRRNKGGSISSIGTKRA
jgi:1,2-phenylacetyl-CoA epoxidase catalytic subunit